MTQCKTLVSQRMRMGRFLEGLNRPGRAKWEPSNDELIYMRKLSRNGFNWRQAYDLMNPPVKPEAFYQKTRQKYAIRWGDWHYERDVPYDQMMANWAFKGKR